MSICPKNKSSKARRDKRRANWKMSAPNLVKCSKCGALMMPHRVCRACGSYNKREIIKMDFFLCPKSRKKSLVAVTRRCINGSSVKLPAIKDTWRWRSRARKNHIGMYRM